MEWSSGVEHQIGNTFNLRAQYVGTRAVNQPYTTQVNGYQTVCEGCFAPFPFGSPADPRFGAVTQLSTGETAITTHFRPPPRNDLAMDCKCK
jgi:hypothetical protein